MLPEHYKKKSYSKKTLDSIYDQIIERRKKNHEDSMTLFKSAAICPSDMVTNAMEAACKGARASEAQTILTIILEELTNEQTN